MNDINAITKCLAGETENFSFLVKKYQNEAFAHAITILGNAEDAMDAVQDAFIDAFRALEKFDNSQRFYPWLYVILRNRCFKIAQSRKRKIEFASGESKILISPRDEKSKAETELVEQALLELTPPEREILTLKHLDGLSYEEIAKRLGIPIGTVMSRLYHARMKFREKIQRIQEKDNE